MQKTAGFGTKAVVGKAVIRQAFIRQMVPSVRAHLATQPDSASLENLAMLASHAVAAKKDVDEAKPGFAEINVTESGKLVGLLEDLSRRVKKLETATAKATKKKTYVARPIDTADAPVCFYHQTFGDKARTCREPCTFSLN